ncbi:DNA-binding response regulator [Roseobacter denitrificans]|uniref:Transcriptional regulatory protein FixJ, putative n=1 Tax=Roseobacter denitrificans (strain ATCC 33942 / OCh 114) TaxID=375451 RepID=Q164J7_ROSDO|nr:response regulator [Roseobacter denitrificans]ABG32596.1 transcriptional regulatory protein FixJ, putative [Roseobacter denitrificans OCh 114]AVL52039.1 DNA-binding response regulator [Roseobacter denitrificans]SFF92656.1 two component transcriptional regulator, LuxR family [Roseobacter denitrificans OCh 114]
MNTASEPCVFIVDDDEDIRTSLSRALRTRGYTTEVFDSAQAFLAGYDAARSGCLILDYGLPQMNGLDLQQVLVKRGRPLPIIFITGHGGVSEAVRAMKHGAVDFLEKPFRQETLLARIETALEMDAKARDVDTALKLTRDKLASLTQREREIAEFLVMNPSNSSSKDVARHLDISPRTVDHHRARILEKMNVQSVAELVDLALTYQLFTKPDP